MIYRSEVHCRFTVLVVVFAGKGAGFVPVGPSAHAHPVVEGPLAENSGVLPISPLRASRSPPTNTTSSCPDFLCLKMVSSPRLAFTGASNSRTSSNLLVLRIFLSKSGGQEVLPCPPAGSTFDDIKNRLWALERIWQCSRIT